MKHNLVSLIYTGTDCCAICRWKLTMALWLCGVLPLQAQQTFAFPVEGKNYRVEVNWNVKHSGKTYANITAHALDFSANNAFDLEVQFRFPEEVPPPEIELLFGFQYRQGGSLIAPSEGEKRARSMRHFQRFQAIGGGNATLTLTPKVWRRTPEGTIEPLAAGSPTTLGFATLEKPSTSTAAALPPIPDTPVRSAPVPSPPTEPPLTPAQKAENDAYAKATGVPDSVQRIRALIDFIDQYRTSSPQSPNVQKALREVPLSASLPQAKAPKQVTYVLEYAVNPVIDTSQADRWQWKIENISPGRYQLTLSALSDTATAFTLADVGKSAPFNQPRTLQPFARVQVSLVGQTKDLFTIRFVGGTPPFMVYLLQDRITRMRYLVSHTDTVVALSKAACTVCPDGLYTLEVYTGDFSTLLLREMNIIEIDRPNRLPILLALGAVALLLVVFRKSIVQGWRYYKYRRQLREIEAWERIIEEEAKRRKGR
ncbi:MAG: hypothetical protein NZM43_03510 [Saprospiraceae bacterium]|nr:hypothetical protein [Saprospiraceae bacterium]MDW8483372.1 hypothetical protein [Saprospiraceae bacterium]